LQYNNIQLKKIKVEKDYLMFLYRFIFKLIRRRVFNQHD